MALMSNVQPQHHIVQEAYFDSEQSNLQLSRAGADLDGLHLIGSLEGHAFIGRASACADSCQVPPHCTYCNFMMTPGWLCCPAGNMPLFYSRCMQQKVRKAKEALPGVAVQGTETAACCAARQPDLLWMCWDQKAECCAGSSAEALVDPPRKAP